MPTDHPSCSKQHAVLQCAPPPPTPQINRFCLLKHRPSRRYRLHVSETVANGLVETVKPYLIDLETTNGCPTPPFLPRTQTVAVFPFGFFSPALASQPTAGTFIKSGAAWQRLDVARYYELKDGDDPHASTSNPEPQLTHHS